MLEILHQGIGDDEDAIRRRLAGRWTPSHGGAPIGPPDVRRACQALAAAGARWRALPTGGTLTVTWPDAPERARGGGGRGPPRRAGPWRRPGLLHAATVSTIQRSCGSRRSRGNDPNTLSSSSRQPSLKRALEACAA
jgi:hypothetical protein